MNLFFRISEMYIPASLKKRELLNLFRIVASAFESEIPPTSGLSFEECLVEFARFTQTEVEYAISRHRELQIIEDRLFRGSFEFGEKFKRRFHVSTIKDAMAASRLLYRILGIDFQGTEQGTIAITKCFFSNSYSSSTCRMISSLDAGILAGLSGGAMTFSERMTEGFASCKAQIIMKEQLR